MTRPADIPQSVWDATEPFGESIYGRHERGFVMWPIVQECEIRTAIARAILAATEAEKERAAKAGSSEVMRFRARIGKRYYAGYHEDMRDAVAAAIRKATP